MGSLGEQHESLGLRDFVVWAWRRVLSLGLKVSGVRVCGVFRVWGLWVL